jgi:flagellar hook protein FlgE
LVTVTVTNANGKSKLFTTSLNTNLEWQIDQADLTDLDPANTGPLQVEAQLQTYQTAPVKTAFSAPVVTADGEKGMVRIELTQTLPIPEEGSEWQADAKLLKYDSPYDPTQTYDPQKYYVDKVANKVYEIIDQQEGTLLFNGYGALQANSLPTLDNGGTPLQIDFGTLYDPNTPNTGFDGLTSMDQMDTGIKQTSADGYLEGKLKGYTVEPDGTIWANFTNTKSSAVARIPVYHFQNDQGLYGEGGVYFSTSANSGQAFMYTDANGKVIQGATVQAFSLESSNVRLENALTEMIVMQKAFDANAKSITTGDQMIQTAINMKK